ncbi:MAG: alpha-2-macroglobulin, partial [Planctomycetaceae bacterium]|nr:alpha-2-macroglobulin [Planctomycetaceae bacterium]
MLRKSAVAAASLLCLITVLVAAVEEPVTQRRALALKQMKQGNFREAEAGFRALALDPQNDPKLVGQDLRNGIACLNRLNRSAEIDAFREQVIGVHAGNWRLLQSAAQTYIEGPSHGFVVAGKFQRGNRRGGGRYVSSLERDRVRALQLMQQAATLVAGDDDTAGVAAFYFDFARFLAHGRQYNEAWKLQVLTDLSVLPDYDAASRFGFRGPGSAGAPVDADGNPVFYKVPAEFEQAENDGERWRSMLKQTSTTAPARSNQVRSLFAQFLQSQFGVQTMQSYGLFFGRQAVGDEKKDESSPYALHTLNDEETICKLATGIKRLTLPDEFNHVKIFQEVAGAGKSSYGERALDQLAQISENRRQYPQAAGRWNQAIAQYGPGNNERRPKRVKQIVGNWARFEGTRVHPAGAGASIDFRFRNGRKVHFEAQAIKTEKLLEDVKEYLKTRPKRLDYNRLQIGNIGYQLVQNNQSQYLGEVVARWDLDLKPNREHFDKRITVTTPLQKAGAYLLTAKMDQGNVSRIVVWVSDTVIVKKQLDGKAWYFVADAVSGKPIPRANVEFFGYRQRRVGRQYEISTSNFAELTDEDGQVTPNPKQLTREFSWVAIARKQGRLAFLGFEGVWYGRRYDAEYNQIKVFTITDRPVYRPGQKVSFKFWVRNAKYDKDDVSQFAKQKFPIVITNPKGEKILETTIAADEWGGIEGEYELKSDATLGQYRLSINRRKSGIVSKLTGSQLVAVGGGGAFRVEEYKKPEFEVVVEAPKEPSKLGDAIDATIKANYYFGAPVAHAKVHYKVQRTSYSKQWYPIARWDWLYGSGYWWFGYDYAWYPGWNVWGCKRPIPPWWPVRRDPPELVLDNTVEIGADGTVKVRIDTALAKEMHPDQDHEYEITAEVVDASRRTIVGVGKVLVARRPFKVFSWLSRGHYEAGDVVEANFKAQTLDEKPVQGKGEVTLLKVTYDDEGEPTETAVQKWKLDTDERGESRLQFKASSPGQFRIAYKVTDKKKNTIEGGYVFSVRGQGFDGSQFRFNDIEIVTDKKQYKPGETVKAMINTDRVGSTVVLFLRPTNGVYLPPKIIRLTGKSTLQEVAVVRKDMPNFYIEAFTIADARVFEETRNIVVPPEKRVVNVDVQPSAASYTPGQKATVKLKLTDAEGEPFAGSVAMSMYDKSVEYISGGSNVPEIKAFFWKWRRNHNPQSNSSLNRYFSNLLERGETGMSNIGTFGHITGVPEDKSEGKGAGGAFGGGVSSRAKKMAAPGRAMPAMAAMEIADAAPEGQAGTADNLVTPTIRTKFADTAFWDASITTDEDGLAEVKLTMPENLTGWKIRSWAMGHGTNVGQGEAEVVTAKNLLVRMQAPRFFTEKDEVVLSANVHNYLKVAKQAHVVLELDEKTLGSTGSLTQIVEIPAGGEVRVDWR